MAQAEGALEAVAQEAALGVPLEIVVVATTTLLLLAQIYQMFMQRKSQIKEELL